MEDSWHLQGVREKSQKGFLGNLLVTEMDKKAALYIEVANCYVLTMMPLRRPVTATSLVVPMAHQSCRTPPYLRLALKLDLAHAQTDVAVVKR